MRAGGLVGTGGGEGRGGRCTVDWADGWMYIYMGHVCIYVYI